MKVLAINGSPKGKDGVTYFMVEEFLKGAKLAGAEVEHILLSEKKIHHCIGCFSCWVKTPGICVFNDDMKDLLKKECDILVYASPLYVDNVTGLMKNFMDRSIPLVLPFIEKDKKGESVHLSRKNKRPKLVIISNCGFPEDSHFQTLKHLFKRVSRNMKTDIIAQIYRSEGPLLVNGDERLVSIIDKYKTLLQQAGTEVVNRLEISFRTKRSLKKFLIPKSVYLKNINSHFKEMLSKCE